jgi:hypothetical protein
MDATSLRDDEKGTTFATFRFDLCGPSYARGIATRNGEGIVPGFFVADVIIGTTLGEEDVAPFLRKIDMLSGMQKLPRFFPALIADNFTPDALRLCRSKGIMATRPSTIFGEEVGRGLSELLDTLSNAAAVAASRPEKLESLFNKLSAIEGRAGNLRGALFEVIVAHLVSAIDGGSIDVGAPARHPDTGESAEIDVRRILQKRTWIYECKGYQPSSLISLAEIEHWLTSRIPLILASETTEQRFRDNQFEFSFWTCGGFHPDALKALEKASTRVKRYSITWKDGSAIKNYATGLASQGVRKILDEHYFKHPLVSYREETLFTSIQDVSDARAIQLPVQNEECRTEASEAGISA